MESEIDHIIKLLMTAHQAAFYADLRRRYASTEQWQVEGPKIEHSAAANWQVAKILISKNRNLVDKYIKSNKDTERAKVLAAATQVIDKEVETQFEKQFLQEDPMGRVKASQIEELENELHEEEYDEDEEYLREQEALDKRDLWDGDDYLGDVSDEEDEFFDDEE